MKKRILDRLIALAIGHRSFVYSVALVLTLLMVGAASFLKFDTRWTELLPPDLPEVRESKKIDSEFLQPANMIVAISGEDPVQIERITDEVIAKLNRELLAPPGADLPTILKTRRYGRYVYGHTPENWLLRNMAALAKPKDAARLARTLSDPRLIPYLTHLNDDLEREYGDAENVKNDERRVVASLGAMERFLKAINLASRGDFDQARLDRVIRDQTVGRPYTMSLDNKMSLVMVASALPFDDMENSIKLDYRLEELLAPLVKKYPDVKIERTGMTAVGRDEMDSIGPYTILLTLVSLLGIYALLAWNFRSPLIPFLTLAPIVLGITWSMGVIALTLGYLNLITSMMMVVLLGLGVDFTIHLTARFRDEIAGGQSIEKALEKTIGETGGAVITGALTTAIAFFTLMIADARAIYQFGFCAGTGTLLTLLASLWLLPALLASYSKSLQKRGKSEKANRELKIVSQITRGSVRLKRPLAFAGVLLIVAGFYAGSKLHWEYNFMNLEPENLRSIELQDEIVERFKLSTTVSYLTVKDPEESRKLRKQLKDKRVVGDVDDISLWLSRPDFEKNLASIRKLRKTAGRAYPRQDLNQATNYNLLLGELERLWQNLVEIQALSITGGQERILQKTSALVGRRKDRAAGALRQLIRRLEDKRGEVDLKTLNRFAAAFAPGIQKRARQIGVNEQPVRLADIPPRIRARYIGKSEGDYLITIMPKENLYTKEQLEIFQASTRRVSPAITGLPGLVLEMNRTTLSEGRLAMLLAALVILMVIMLDFRRPLLAFLTILPLALGLALTMGTLFLLGEKLNYVNIIALPVLIGIGVDDGVHFVHRYLHEKDIEKSARSVGRAIFITSLTTMFGFGSLMFYLMRGMASLGMALFIGVGFCLLVSITLLPAIIKFFESRILTNPISQNSGNFTTNKFENLEENNENIREQTATL